MPDRLEVETKLLRMFQGAIVCHLETHDFCQLRPDAIVQLIRRRGERLRCSFVLENAIDQRKGAKVQRRKGDELPLEE